MTITVRRSTDWEYRSFTIGTDGLPKGFLQGVVEEMPKRRGRRRLGR